LFNLDCQTVGLRLRRISAGLPRHAIGSNFVPATSVGPAEGRGFREFRWAGHGRIAVVSPDGTACNEKLFEIAKHG
jgi:hypothetical protein